MSQIQLSKTTRAIMSNFASISPAFCLEQGNILRVADAETGTVYARAEIEETFPMDFPIADINQLLRILKLSSMKECGLEFFDEDASIHEPKRVMIKGAGVSVKFVASSSLMVSLPKKEEEPRLPEDPEDISFEAEIEHQALSDFKTACDTLGLTHAILKNENGESYLVGQDPTIDNSSDYILKLGKTDKPDCEVPVLVSSLKLVESDYTFRAVGNVFINATSRNEKISYFISAEEV